MLHFLNCCTNYFKWSFEWIRKLYLTQKILFFCVYFRNYVLNLNGMEVIIQEIFFALNEWVMLRRGPNLKHNNVLLPFFLCYIHALFKVSKIGLSIVLWNIMSIIVKMSFHIKELDNLLKRNCYNYKQFYEISLSIAYLVIGRYTFHVYQIK